MSAEVTLLDVQAAHAAMAALGKCYPPASLAAFGHLPLCVRVQQLCADAREFENKRCETAVGRLIAAQDDSYDEVTSRSSTPGNEDVLETIELVRAGMHRAAQAIVALRAK